MRISDWSSDVCSSDLDQLRLANRHLIAQPHVDLRFRLRTTPERKHAAAPAERQMLSECGCHTVDVAQFACLLDGRRNRRRRWRSEEHTSELQSLMRISYAVFCLKKKKQHTTKDT